MVSLENRLAFGVPWMQMQKRWTQAVQQNQVCRVIEPLFTKILHTGFKRKVGETMFPLFMAVSPREALMPSIICFFTAGAISAGLKQVWRAPRPFYIRRDLLIGTKAEGYASPSLHSTIAAATSVFWTMRFLTVTNIVLCVVLTASVMLSRVYVGVHWATDTVSGALIGAMCGLFFGSDAICLWLSNCFFDDSIHSLFPAAMIIATINFANVWLRYVVYIWCGPIDADLLAFYNISINPGIIERAGTWGGNRLR